MRDFLNTLIYVASLAGPWSQPTTDNEDYKWTHNDWLQVAPDRRMTFFERDPNETCSNIFGEYGGSGSGKRWAGCTMYGYDEDGLISYVFGPRRNIDVMDHEARHGAGELHPWEGMRTGK